MQLSEVKDTVFRETESRLAKLKEDSNELVFGQNREDDGDDLLMQVADLQVEVEEEFKNANSLLVEKLKEARVERDRLQIQLDQTVHSSVK